jgi:hypothetical protein
MSKKEKINKKLNNSTEIDFSTLTIYGRTIGGRGFVIVSLDNEAKKEIASLAQFYSKDHVLRVVEVPNLEMVTLESVCKKEVKDE